MSSINEIEIQIKRIEDRIDKHADGMQRIRNEISEAMNMAQDKFGKTSEGQTLVLTLSEALNHLSVTDASLYCLKSNLEGFVARLKS